MQDGIAEMFRAAPGLPHYLARVMRFPFRLRVLLCVAACLLHVDVHSEPARPKVPVSAVAEIIHAPTDLAALRKVVGRRVVLEGKIVATGSSRTGSTSYLNFTKNYHDSVSLVFLGTSGAKGIAKADIAAFVGRKIHIGGILEDRNGALQMRVFELEQIKVMP